MREADVDELGTEIPPSFTIPDVVSAIGSYESKASDVDLNGIVMPADPRDIYTWGCVILATDPGEQYVTEIIFKQELISQIPEGSTLLTEARKFR